MDTPWRPRNVYLTFRKRYKGFLKSSTPIRVTLLPYLNVLQAARHSPHFPSKYLEERIIKLVCLEIG
jgi:hypothetical protein